MLLIRLGTTLLLILLRGSLCTLSLCVLSLLLGTASCVWITTFDSLSNLDCVWLHHCFTSCAAAEQLILLPPRQESLTLIWRYDADIDGTAEVLATQHCLMDAATVSAKPGQSFTVGKLSKYRKHSVRFVKDVISTLFLSCFTV